MCDLEALSYIYVLLQEICNFRNKNQTFLHLHVLKYVKEHRTIPTCDTKSKFMKKGYEKKMMPSPGIEPGTFRSSV